jgi:flagella synthesis protein FlgN
MPPNNASPDGSVLLARLKAENIAWQALLDVLQDEEQALIAGQADRVALLNTAKLAQLQCVSDHARGRHGELLAAGHTPNHAGMNAWLAQIGLPDLNTRWQRLCTMERDAQVMNQRIGSLIELRLAATRQALNVLVHSATHQGGLYDHAGLAVSAHKGKPLTAA